MESKNNINKSLIISLILFVISIWISTYIFLPYFAIGGINYYAYDITNIINIFINIVIPASMYIFAIVLANYFFRKSIGLLSNISFFIVLLCVMTLFFVFLVFFGIMVMHSYYDIINWTIGYAFCVISVIDIIVWSILAIRALVKSKKVITKI